MPGLFKLDIVCKIGRQGFVKGAHRDLSYHLASASAALAAIQRGQDASWCYTVGSAGKQSSYTASSRVPYYTLSPLHLPQPFKITSHHKIFMNRAVPQPRLSTAGGCDISNCPILPSTA